MKEEFNIYDVFITHIGVYAVNWELDNSEARDAATNFDLYEDRRESQKNKVLTGIQHKSGPNSHELKVSIRKVVDSIKQNNCQVGNMRIITGVNAKYLI